MDETYQELTKRVLHSLSHTAPDHRLLISLTGSPGSGKTTVTSALIKLINLQYHKSHPMDPDIAIAVSQDGFHLTQQQLNQFPDPAYAISKRGAPFTFDAAKLLALIHDLHLPITASEIKAPSFDHHIKDPLTDSVVVKPHHKVVIIEGNYLLLKDPFWNEIATLVDDRWVIRIDKERARKRVIQRHLNAGISKTLEDAIARCDGNDMVNAEYIKINSYEPDIVIDSIDEL